MANVRGFWGAKYFIPYNRTTFKPYGVFQVMQEVALERSIEQVELLGGDAAGAWDSEAGQPENSITGTFREFPNFAFEMLEGATITSTAADSAGFVSAILNKKNDTVVDATTGIASIALKVGEEGALIAGRVILVAATTTTVDIYASGLLGSGNAFSDDTALIVAGVTIPGTGATVDVDDIGITITGGSGSIAMVAGDTAYFESRPINSGGSEIIEVGGSATIQEFGAWLVYPKKSDGQINYVDFFRIKAAGMPFGATSKEWSEWELAGKPIVDNDQGGDIYKMYRIKADV